jgi:hypothetical protein
MFSKRFYYPVSLGVFLAGFGLTAFSPVFSIDTSLIKISPPVQRSEPDPRFIHYSFAPGTAFHVLTQTPISTEINQPDDPVEAITNQTLYLYEELIIPKNTRFIGRISRLEPPLEGKDAVLSIVFHEIILENGEKLPIVAHVRTERPDHSWGGELTRGTKPLLSTQRVTGIGEYNKIVWGGPRAMGKHITIPPGEHWTLILDQPLHLLKAREEYF